MNPYGSQLKSCLSVLGSRLVGMGFPTGAFTAAGKEAASALAGCQTERINKACPPGLRAWSGLCAGDNIETAGQLHTSVCGGGLRKTQQRRDRSFSVPAGESHRSVCTNCLPPASPLACSNILYSGEFSCPELVHDEQESISISVQ